MRDEPSLLFVIPDTSAFQSGGNIYNANLVEALKRIGILITQQTIEQFAACTTTEVFDAIIWDSLYLQDALLGKALRRSPTFLLVHHLESLHPPEGWNSTAYFLEKEYAQLTRFTGFVVNSPFMQTHLSTHFPNKRYALIPPALGITPHKKQKSTDHIRALIIGNLIERKGILPFLKLLEKYPIPKLLLRLIGSTAHEPSYAKACLASIKKLPQVTYMGELSHTQISTQYNWANLLLSCSAMETFGMAMQEAVAFGIPILALDRGNASAHVQQGHTGWLSPTIESLVAQLQQLHTQPQLHATFLEGALQQKKWETYSWADAAAALVEAIIPKPLNP
ncbi:MAG: glycosyltransferase family 4 protein [Bacteroidota bacterium]